MGHRLFAATALLMGTAIGILMTACGLQLVGSPWEFHFARHYVAAIAVVLTGLMVVVLGVVMVLDLFGGARHLRHRP